MWFGNNELFLGIFYLEIFFIFYFLLYFLIFPFQDKKLNLQKKWYFLLRDFVILFSVFCFFWLYNDIVWKYMKYHDWYLSEENFWGEEFVCLDDSVTLLLEQNYRHEVIVNPYKNFFEFYKNYWTHQKTWIILTNKLQKKLVTETFLSTCRNINWENYYDKYMKIHGKKPYFKHIEYKINYKYFLNNSQVEIILEKLKNKEHYINNLTKYSYKEFDLNFTVGEFDEDFWKKNKIEKFSEEKRKILFPEYLNWETIDYFQRILEIKSKYSAKSWKEYSSEEFGLQEWFYKKLIKESGGWVDFFKEGNITYSTTKTSLYKWTQLLFKNNNLNLWTSWPFSNLWKVWELFTFEFNYFDTENNKEFQDKQCVDILYFWKDSYWNCFIKYNEDWSTQLSCEDPDLLKNLEESQKKYIEYKKCHKLKYESITNNIWLWGEILNQKYNLEESKNIFKYNDNIWFIAKRKWQYFIMYNWVQISENFDYIRTNSCCMIHKFPFNIYGNWILEYVFERDNRLFLAFIQLK